MKYEMILEATNSARIYFFHDYHIKMTKFEEGMRSETISIQNEVIEHFKKVITRQKNMLLYKYKDPFNDWKGHIIYDIFYYHGFKEDELYIREIRHSSDILIMLPMVSVKKINKYFQEKEKEEKIMTEQKELKIKSGDFND